MRFLKSIICLFLFVYTIKAQNIYTYAGTGISGYTPDGSSVIGGRIGNPYGMCADNSGNIYYLEGINLRKINSSGFITTIAGSPTLGFGFSGDGGPATSAQFNTPDGIAIDASGNIYVADNQNHRIRKIDASGIINTIAGTGTIGYSGDGGPATSAQISSPVGITVDLSGNIYFTEEGFGYDHIRKINSSGIISTLAGTGISGFSGDGGPSTLAQINQPFGITTDASGNIYFGDLGNARIRKINTSGIISTIAGNGTFGYSGDGGLATNAQIRVWHLTADASGNVYFVASNGIRKINTSTSIITTVAGNGTGGYSGDGGPATSAQVGLAYGITLDALNNIYFGQQGIGASNQCIRVVCQNNCLAGVNENSKANDQIKIYPNPVSNNLFISSEQYLKEGTEIEIINYLDQTVLKTEFKNQIDVSELTSGFYTLLLKDDSGSIITKKFIKE